MEWSRRGLIRLRSHGYMAVVTRPQSISSGTVTVYQNTNYKENQSCLRHFHF